MVQGYNILRKENKSPHLVSKASVFHHFGSMETIEQEAFILTDLLMGEALEQIYQNARETDSFADIMLKYFLFFIEEKNNYYLNLINVQIQFVMKSSYDTEFEELVFGKDSEKTPFDFFEILVNDFYGDKLDANDLKLVNDLIVVHINGFAAFLISKADQEWLVSIWKENIKIIENYIESYDKFVYEITFQEYVENLGSTYDPDSRTFLFFQILDKFG